MTNQELWRLDATAQAEAIRERQFTSVELVQAHLDRIDAVNPTTNAVVRRFDEEALAAAAVADDILADGRPVGLLHGVPVTIKTNLPVSGQITDESSASFLDNVAHSDAPAVAHLRAAGAIFHGRTNMPDLGMRWNTDSPLYGQTYNPWDRTKSPGGSSGGDGVAVATGMTPLGLGNDFGGSVRVPAAYSGVAGLRPTPGRIPYEAEDPGDRLLGVSWFYTDGPIARSVRDLQLSFDILSQGDARDPFWEDVAPGPSGPCDVILLQDSLGVAHHPEIAQGLADAADALRDAGYRVTEGQMPSVTHGANLWRDIIATDLSHVMTGDVQQLFGEDAQAWLRASLETSTILSQHEYLQATAHRAWIAAEWSRAMAKSPLVLGAVDPGLSWDVAYDRTGDIGAAVVSLRERYALNLVGSFLGLATAVVPAGVGPSSFPRAVQLTAWRFQERRALVAAAAIEERLGTLTPIDPV